MDKKEELQLWKRRIEIARQHRETYLRNWIYWENIFDDNLWSINSFSGRRLQRDDPVQLNELESIIMNILPKIDFNMPIFDVEDNLSGDTFSALVYEFYAIKIFELLDMFDNIRQIILDTLLCGGGLHKTGITYDVDQGTDDVIEEAPVSQWVSPKNFLWDYRFDTWKTKQWVAEEYIKTVEDVKEMDIYSNTKNLKGNLSSNYNVIHIEQHYNKDDEMVKLVEIHDIKNKRLMTISITHDEFLRYEDDYEVETYDILEFTPTRPRRFFGKSLPQSLEEHLIRLAKVNHWMDSDSAQNGRQIYMVDSSVGNDVIKKLESKSAKLILPIDGLINMGNNPIQEVKFTQKTFNWMSITHEVERQIRMLTGSSMQDRGAHEPGVETAVEANMLAEASEVRNKDRALSLSIFIQKIMTKMLTLTSSFVSPARLAEIIGMPVWMAYRVQPFDKMKLTVKFGSTAIESRNNYLQKLMLLGRSFPNNINQQALMRKMMESLGFGLRDMSLLASNQTPPMSAVGSPDQASQSAQQQPELAVGGIQNPF